VAAAVIKAESISCINHRLWRPGGISEKPAGSLARNVASQPRRHQPAASISVWQQPSRINGGGSLPQYGSSAAWRNGLQPGQQTTA